MLKKLSLVLLMGLLVISGLAQDTEPNTEVAGDVTVWGYATGNAWMKDSGLLDAFSAAYPNITVELIDISPADLRQNLPLAISSGAGGPDITSLEDSYLPQIVELGGVVDLTEWMTPYAENYTDAKLAVGMLEGRHYALPYDVGPAVFFYRRDVFEKAGLTSDPESVDAMVATWDSLLETCQTIKDETGLYCFPQNRANNYGDLYEIMLWQQGLGYLDEEGRITIDTPAHIATLETLGQFWDAELVSDQLDWTDGWYAGFASTEEPVAGVIVGAWMGGFLKGWIAPETDGLWGVARMPAMEEGQPRASNQGGSQWSILEQSDAKDAAWAFIEFVATREDNIINALRDTDLFPASLAVYENEIFAESDPFFGEQAQREVYASVAQEVPASNIYNRYFQTMHGAVASAIQQYATGALSAEEALKLAAEDIRVQTGLE